MRSRDCVGHVTLVSLGQSGTVLTSLGGEIDCVAHEVDHWLHARFDALSARERLGSTH